MERGSKAWFDRQYLALGERGYDGFAANLRGSQVVRLEQIAALLAATVPLSGRILDLGCATGEFLALLPRSDDGERHGCDLSLVALQYANRRFPEGRFSQAALPRLPYRDQAFAGVICLELLYYLDAAQRRLAMAELSRILQPGGWCCCSARLDDGRRYLAETEMLALVAPHFRVIRQEYHRVYWYRWWERGCLAGWRRWSYLGGVIRQILADALPAAALASPGRRLLARWAADPGRRWRVTRLLACCNMGEAWLRTLLAARWPVRLAYYLGRRILPQRSRTGIVLLLRAGGSPASGGSQFQDELP